MAQFVVNSQRFDPYKNFKFRVKFGPNTQTVAGVSKISMLKRTTEVVKHREGGDPSSSRKSPGRTEYDAITMERGVTHDKDFEQWANKVWNYGEGLGSEVSLKDFRKDPDGGSVQRGRPTRDQLQHSPVLGIRIPGDVGLGCQCERNPVPTFEDRERGMVAR